MTERVPGVRLGRWLQGDGPDSDIVISARIRIARNVTGFPLKARLTEDEERQLCEHLEHKIEHSRLGPQLKTLRLHEMDPVERLVLVERHVISLEHANATGRRSVAKNEEESVAVMLNEEDHLRIQVIAPGLSLDESFDLAQDLHERLGNVFP